ncbi:MAG: beta-galactosidase [Armatimonadetes bacterium]|nr:beta-galactosidase [Armatimonadota bacterium]
MACPSSGATSPVRRWGETAAMQTWVICGILAYISLGVPQQNLAPNPGFEADADDNGEPDGWWKWGGPGEKAPTNLRRVSDRPHSGQWCAEVRDSSTQGNFYVASQYLPVEPGHAYVLYVWARGQWPGQTAAIRIDELDTEKKYIRGNTRVIHLQTEWQEYHVVAARLDDRTRFVQLSLQPCLGAYQNTGVAWYDDVRFELADDRLRERVSGPDGDDWFPFPLDWRDGGPSPIDVTQYLPIEKTGTHGFLTIRGGHFVFQDGTRARFWATNIHSHSAAYPTKEQAESFAARLARLGVNMVRVHLLEYASPAGLVLVSDETSERLDPERLDRFDYLMAQFHEHGIYVILDALPMCARRFSPADGVKAFNEWRLGAKGASYFDRRIIELEQSYARQLLLHYNPYRGVRYVDDPTVALYEMSNEDGLLLWWSWSSMPKLYLDELQAMWNRWLVEHVGDRATLARRWTDAGGNCALADEEDPQRGTVALAKEAPSHPLRRIDYHRFLAEVQREYWTEQVKFLRGLGVRVPICGTNIMSSPAMMASWDPLDYTDTHAYWDHPQYDQGQERWVTNRPMVAADPLQEATLPSEIAMAEVAGKPAVATEWNTCWPNQWRAADVLMTPAYALLNDMDIVYIYCYMGGWGLGPDNVRPKIHHATVIFSDPAETGLSPVLALMYRRGDVRRARNTVEMGISGTDAYLAREMYACPGDFQHFVPLISSWQARLFDARYQPSPDADLTVTSGFSATGDYQAARRLMLWVGPDWNDGRGTDRLASARLFEPSLRNAGDGIATLSGELPQGSRLALAVPAACAIDAEAVGGRWRPWLLGKTAAGTTGCLGIEQEAGEKRRSIAPGAGEALQGEPSLLARWFTDVCQRWGLLGPDQGFVPRTGEIVSDTGELRWQPAEGIWTCATERACVVAGFLGGKTIAAGPMEVAAKTAFGTYSLVSLDGQPIADSSHLLIVAVGRAENAGQKIKEVVFVEPGKLPEPLGKAEVIDPGSEPVMVQGLEATVTIRGTRRGEWSCWALAPSGQRTSTVPTKRTDTTLSVRLAPAFRTIYYELTQK